jgi:hypothetical protein
MINIHHKTVKNISIYHLKNTHGWESMLKSMSKKIDKFMNEILESITDFRDMSAAQVLDWTKEGHGNIEFKER